MSHIRAVLRASALHSEDPADVLTRLDDHVTQFQPDTMATVLCGMLTPATGALRLSSAGHPSAILAAPHRAAATVQIRPDLPVGVANGHPRHSSEVPFPPGSVLCLYSDGLVERRDLVIDDNIDKLRATVPWPSPGTTG